MGLKRRNPARTLVFTVPDMLFDIVRPEIVPGEGEPKQLAKARPVRPLPSREERHGLIAAVAYGYAERAGFRNDPVEDWLRAEREIDMSLELRLAS